MYSPPSAGAHTEARLQHTSAVRYIKLGQGGSWAPQSIDLGIVPFGFSQVPHASCAAGNWDKAREELAAAGRTKTGVTQGVRELRGFYTLGPETLWVTFADRHLYWTFAAPKVVAVEQPEPGT